jgi:hypothetical protein
MWTESAEPWRLFPGNPLLDATVKRLVVTRMLPGPTVSARPVAGKDIETESAKRVFA